MSDYSSYTDAQLLSRLASGDEMAFTAIYNRYWEKLLAIAFLHLRDKQAAEDILHEVMISLWTRKAELSVQSLSSYLATAIKFAVFKAISREKRRKELRERFDASGISNETEDQLDALFLRETLRNSAEQLPEKARLVFTYSRSHEMTISEIAQKMNLSPKAVEYHMTKALHALKTTLKKIKLLFV